MGRQGKTHLVCTNSDFSILLEVLHVDNVSINLLYSFRTRFM